MTRKAEDYISAVSGDRLAHFLAEGGHFLRKVAATTMAQTKLSDLQFALRTLVDRVGFELERLAICPDDVEQAARAVRNCLETNLIGRYVLASQENLQNWFALRPQEEVDILSKILQLQVIDEGNLDEARHSIESRIQQKSLLREKHGGPQAVPLPNWARLARDHGLENVYAAYYSLFSKYVHPSTMNVFPQDTEFVRTVTNLFTSRSQIYAVDLTVRSLDALGIGGDAVFSTGPWVKTGVAQ